MAIETNTPLLSVIVPTRNRACYAKSCIRSLLQIQSPGLEVIVHDNSDSVELRQFVEQHVQDSRLRYYHRAERLDVIANFNLATELARGSYITYLGDDDGLNPEIMDAAAWAESEDYEAVITSRPAQFWWPDVRFRHFGDRAAGNLDITTFSGKVSQPDPERELWKCARAAASGIGDLPRVYYGIVKRACLDQLRAKTRAYCRVSPDMSTSVGLAAFVQRMAKIDYPIFLPGSSAKSTAGLGANKQHMGRLEDQPHLPAECLDQWSDLVPRFFSASTIWAEACVQTLRATKREDVLRQFNLPLLHAGCVVFNPEWAAFSRDSFYRLLRRQGRSRLWGMSQLLSSGAWFWTQRAHSLWRNVMKLDGVSSTKVISGLEDIESAVMELTNLLTTRNVSLVDFLEATRSVALQETKPQGLTDGPPKAA